VYFKRVLAVHPDKGGDPEVFRSVQAAWEVRDKRTSPRCAALAAHARTPTQVLRELFDTSLVHAHGFSYYFGAGTEEAARASPDMDGRPRQSWEYFAQAAAEEVPAYRVEVATSGRSECKACKDKVKRGLVEDTVIALGTVRFGSMNEEAGSYGRWHHLRCWRVPASIWLGLPDASCTDPALFEAALVGMQRVVFVGYTELSEENKRTVVAFVMDSKNWARRIKKSTTKLPFGSAAAAGECGGEPAAAEPVSQALVATGGRGGAFIVPRLGMNGALAGALQGQTFVVTGIFPELGGGSGLDLGKAKCKAMVEAFGGKVTGSISGKTSYLIVGKQPGASKVSAAAGKGVQRIDIQGLKDVLESGGARALKDAPPVAITAFSAGFRGNGLAALTDVDHLYDPPAKAKATKATKAIKAPKAEQPAVPKAPKAERAVPSALKAELAAPGAESAVEPAAPKRGKQKAPAAPLLALAAPKRPRRGAQ